MQTESISKITNEKKDKILTYCKLNVFLIIFNLLFEMQISPEPWTWMQCKLKLCKLKH